jgi:probable O-glycosylation ligase (exosortase A-associated)
MRDLALMLLLFGGIPLGLVYPLVAAGIYIAISVGSIHTLAYNFVAWFPWAIVYSSVMFLGLLFNPKYNLLVGVRRYLPFIPLLIIFSISTLVHHEQEWSVERYTTYIKSHLALMLLLAAIRNRTDLLWLLFAYVAGIAVHALNGSLILFTHFTSKGIEGPRSSFITDNNHFAAALIMCLPVLAYFALTQRNKRLRLMAFGTFCACLLVAMGTWSRGGIVTLFALAVMTLFIMKAHRLKILLMVVPLGLAIFFAMPDGFHKRMDTIDTYEQDGSAMGRISAWETAQSLASSEPFGGGFDHYRDRDRWKRFAPEGSIPRAAHSIYFQLLGDHGYLGLIVFLLLIVLTLLAALRSTKHAPPSEKGFDLGRALGMSLLALLSGGAFLSLAYWEALYMLIAFVFVTAELSRNSSRSVRIDPPGHYVYATIGGHPLKSRV